MKNSDFELAEKEILDLIESIKVVAKHFVDKELPQEAEKAIGVCRDIRHYILEDNN